MLYSANDLPRDAVLHARVCVAGAGPAGIAVARTLASAGIDVLLVESGGFSPDRDVESLSAGDVAAGSPHSSLSMYRRRLIGGTSYVWGGRCVPLDPIDFEYRDWMPHSGWPIAYEDLLPWYESASAFLDAGMFDYSAEGSLPGHESFVEGFSSPILRSDRIERFSLPTNVGRKYRSELVRSKTLRVLHHAVVTHIRVDRDNGDIRSLALRTLRGASITAVAQVYVLALGTIETIRLMLASNDVCAAGIGNQGGWLGASYLSHLEGIVGELRLDPPTRRVIWGYEKSIDGVYVRRRLSLPDRVQRSQRIGSFIARLHHPTFSDPEHRNGILSAAYLTKSFLAPEYGSRVSWADRRTAEKLAQVGRTRLLSRHAVNVFRDLPAVLAFGPRWIYLRNFRRRKLPSLALRSKLGLYPLDINIEQSPNRASRIELLDTLDRLGTRQVRVNWQMNNFDRLTIARSLQLIQSAFSESGCGHFVVDVEEAADRITPIGGHQLGGARMSTSAQDGVVDPNCMVFGTRNLYLAGSQTFPTVGNANPTLTAVALSLRLGSHLCSRLNR